MNYHFVLVFDKNVFKLLSGRGEAPRGNAREMRGCGIKGIMLRVKAYFVQKLGTGKKRTTLPPPPATRERKRF